MFYNPSVNKSLDCRRTIAASKPDVVLSRWRRVHVGRSCPVVTRSRAAQQWRN